MMFWFWLKWMGGSALGFVAGFVGSFVTIDAATGGQGPEAYGIPFVVAFPVVLAIATVLMATLQWLVIRRRVPGSAGWIAATTGGVLIGALVIFGTEELTGQQQSLLGAAVTGLLHALLLGMVVGFLQWLVLRRVDTSRRWLATTIVVLLVAEAVGLIVEQLTGDGGVGLIAIFLLWQALAAPFLHRLTSRPGLPEPVGERPTTAEHGHAPSRLP